MKMAYEDIKQALAAMAAENHEMREAWLAAHDLAQAHEGEQIYDRLHALCHRIEGDSFNAGYWYRRAGIDPFEGSFAEEAEAILAELGNA